MPPAHPGVGLDFNTELVEAISKVKGANYLSVQTPGARFVQGGAHAQQGGPVGECSREH